MGLWGAREPPMASPRTSSARPPSPRLMQQTMKLSALRVTDLFHGPEMVKMTVAAIMQKMPQPLPLPWLPMVATSTPPNPTAQPRALAGVIRSERVEEMGQNDTKETLGAVQNAAERAGEQGNGRVIKSVLGGGLPQAQSAALGQHFAPGHSGQPPFQQEAGQQHQQAPQHEPDPCKAEDGGGVGGVDGEQPVPQLDEGEGRAPQAVADDRKGHCKGGRPEQGVQPGRARGGVAWMRHGSLASLSQWMRLPAGTLSG